MDNYPKSVTKSQTQIIFNQMNDSFYKIQGEDGEFGIGIFCKIKIKNKNILVLVTNYNLIDEIYIKQNNEIKIIINNGLYLIKFGDKRLNYTNRELDLSVIEIKENQKFKINLIEIDESLYKEESILNNKETIYILHHNNTNKEISVSYGIIRYINTYKFSVSCNINSNGTIAPIFNLKNNKLIGIYNTSKYFIKGTSLKIIIDKLFKITTKNKHIFRDENVIDIYIKVFKEDINKEIYFLNKNFKESLNRINTELYINEILYKYEKYFKPDKEGEYKIRLKFDINLKDCSYMFAECKNIIKLNFILFNTYRVKNMKYMFYKCTNLKEINLLSFDINDIIDMSYMFYECQNLLYLDYSFISNKIIKNYISYCFANSKLLELSYYINIENLDKVEGIFYNRKKLKDLNLSVANDINNKILKRNKELLLILLDNENNKEDTELYLKFNQIKKLDFQNKKINTFDMANIFQNGFKNLEYLNLENNGINNDGLKFLQNKSLINIKYLNLSNNPITDDGLTYLNYLSNLNELILLNMYKLSDDYFSLLQSNSFINKINIVKCDKKKLTLKFVSSNYDKFFLSNLKILELISSTNLDFIKELKILFTLDNICSNIIYLDLSNIGFNDEGIIILTENISKFKKIKQINIEDNHLTSKSDKYLSQLEKKKIKIILKIEKPYKDKYKILLGGSTIAGKTSYLLTYIYKTFTGGNLSTIGFDFTDIKKINKTKFCLVDSSRWGGKYNWLISKKIIKADGVILMFDLSNKKDFDDLPRLLNMITEDHELENFPVLLIGNKSDLDIKVDENEIKKFLDKENFIGYFEVSCKAYKNVEESVDFMVNYIYKNKRIKFL